MKDIIRSLVYGAFTMTFVGLVSLITAVLYRSMNGSTGFYLMMLAITIGLGALIASLVHETSNIEIRHEFDNRGDEVAAGLAAEILSELRDAPTLEVVIRRKLGARAWEQSGRYFDPNLGEIYVIPGPFDRQIMVFPDVGSSTFMRRAHDLAGLPRTRAHRGTGRQPS